MNAPNTEPLALEHKARMALAMIGAVAITTNAQYLRTLNSEQFEAWLTCFCGGDRVAAMMAAMIFKSVVDEVRSKQP